MEFLLIVSFVIIFFMYFFIGRKAYHPIILFNGTWLIVFWLYKLKIINFIEISHQTILILLFMIICFPIGCLFGEKLSNRFNTKNYIPEKISLRRKIFWIICAVTIIKMFYDEMDIIVNVFNGMSFKQVVALAEGKGTVEIKGFSVILYIFFVYPCTYFISPVCANIVFSKEEKNKIYYLLVNLLVVFLSVMHHGGRNAIFVFIICYTVTFFMKKKKVHMRKKTKFAIFIFLIVSIFLIVGISSSRGISDVGESFYAYFTCALPLAELYLQYPIVNGAFLGGMLSFNGFIYPILLVTNYFGFALPQSQVTVISIKEIIEYNYLSIGDYSLKMNAFLPAGVYMYIDGGYVFEIIGMIVYGIVVGYIYHLTKIKNNDRINAVYVLLALGLVLSFTRFYFTTINYSLAFLYLLFLYKKERVGGNI